MRPLIVLSLALATPALAFHLEDPLRNGTQGNPVGGAFADDGWHVTDRTDRIWFALPRLVSGSVEFTVTGITLDNLNLGDHEIFAMYEAGFGIQEPIRYNPDLRNNHYKCLLRIYGTQESDRPGAQKLMWGICPSGAPGYDECGCNSFFEEPFGGDRNWDGSPQRIRVEWGDGRTRYLRNGAEVLVIDWSESGLQFGPDTLHMSLGTPRPVDVGTAGMPVGAVFSDLVVDGEEGPLATCGGATADAGVPLDSGVPQVDGLVPTDDVTLRSDLPDGREPDVGDLAAEQGSSVAYLRFDARGLPGRVVHAVLRLRTRDDGHAAGDGAEVHAVADANWTESTLTWNARPLWDQAPLGATGHTEPSTWYEVDVTAGATGPTPAFALVGAGADGSHFASKEDGGGANAPRLVLTLAPFPPDAGMGVPSDSGVVAPDAGRADAAPGNADAAAADATPGSADATAGHAGDGGGGSGADSGSGSGSGEDDVEGKPAGCGCHAADGSAAPWAVLLALAALRRRRRA